MVMARRKRQEEHENHERWLVSYADFITLLFAFFVVMYSISSINEGKYRVLSDAIVAAFRSPSKSLTPVQIGRLAKNPNSSPVNLPYEYRRKLAELELDRQRSVAHESAAGVSAAASTALKKISGQIKQAMKSLIDQDLVKVRQGKGWLEIELKANILFPSGSAALTEEALPVLRKVAEVLAKHPNPVQVEGHTDNLPIHSLVYPSNWELSAARAASVVQFFAQVGMDPKRMAAIGYGEYRPVADNATAEGRSKNRRVALVVLATETDTPPVPEATPLPAAPPPKKPGALAPISGIQLQPPLGGAGGAQ